MSEELGSERKFQPAVDADELLQELGQRTVEHAPAHHYEVLRQVKSGGETDAELRARYVLYTDKLIGAVKDLATEDGETGPDGLKDTGVTMVFLDKSARPAAWLMSELWDLYAPGYRRPEIKFANIDRQQWQQETGRIDPDAGTFDVDVNRLNPAVFDQLRQTYADPDHTETSVFDGRKVLVVDETKTSGTTLEIAEQMFRRAFPEAKKVEGYHWMVRPSGDAKTSEVPVWYNADTPLGRGVADRNMNRPEDEEGGRQVTGAMFLSTRPDQPDLLAQQLRREMHWLREDMLNGAMRFSVLRHEDDEISPELLKAVSPWREEQRRQK